MIQIAWSTLERGAPRFSRIALRDGLIWASERCCAHDGPDRHQPKARLTRGVASPTTRIWAGLVMSESQRHARGVRPHLGAAGPVQPPAGRSSRPARGRSLHSSPVPVTGYHARLSDSRLAVRTGCLAHPESVDRQPAGSCRSES
eukprot:scaffold1072_cov356-Prasinococcus_capsulatus_cf.AAC.7